MFHSRSRTFPCVLRPPATSPISRASLPRAIAPSNRSCSRAFPCPPQPAVVPSFRAQRGISWHPLCPVRTTLSRFIQANCQRNRFFARPYGLSLNDRAIAPSNRSCSRAFPCPPQPASGFRRVPHFCFPRLSPFYPLSAFQVSRALSSRHELSPRHSERQRGISRHPLCPVRTTLSRFIQANCQRNRFFARPYGLPLNDRACAPCSAPALAHFLVPRSPPLSRHSEQCEESYGIHFALSAPHCPGSFRPTTNTTDSSLGLTASL